MYYYLFIYILCIFTMLNYRESTKGVSRYEVFFVSPGRQYVWRTVSSKSPSTWNRLANLLTTSLNVVATNFWTGNNILSAIDMIKEKQILNIIKNKWLNLPERRNLQYACSMHLCCTGHDWMLTFDCFILKWNAAESHEATI